MEIFGQIIYKKLKQATERSLEETASGFRRGKSIQDHIFTIILFVVVSPNFLSGKISSAYQHQATTKRIFDLLFLLP